MKGFWTDNSISALRTALIAVGAALGSDGLDVVAQTDADKWIGWIMAVASFGWIIMSNFKANKETE